MKRVYKAMLPTDEVEIKKRYQDHYGHRATIEAGKCGWTILSYDYVDYCDNNDTPENNFNNAYNVLNSITANLNEIICC